MEMAHRKKEGAEASMLSRFATGLVNQTTMAPRGNETA
jgi:hypothetical protein